MIVGVGVDIESVDKFRRMRREVFVRVVKRVLTEREEMYCLAKLDPYPHVAARFCVKEAFVKALGVEETWSIPFKDVEVLGTPPELRAHGKAADALKKKGVSKVHASLSHTSDYVVALVLLEA
ncbi:MAG: holo-ACP synthase [Thermofilaceae archaeon]|nr:holo-ACP synthase [Thermofilaceae archaeon]MDW8003436.1 holo-ACP synthase [Thermofilaceae archaeon]